LGEFTQINAEGSKQLYDKLVQVYAQERAQQEKSSKLPNFVIVSNIAFKGLIW
jgi:hypothetical protein